MSKKISREEIEKLRDIKQKKLDNKTTIKK